MPTSPPALSPTCATQARAAGEPLAGTAAEATGWLAIEAPGSWGHDAVLESELDPTVAGVLAERAADLPVRIQILRRPGHRRSIQRAVFLAHTGPERTWARRLALPETRALLDLDLTELLSPVETTTGEPEPEPLYLVCTHAKRDPCCALWGRPVVSALEDLRPRQVWETSHVGGHRFAANVVVLPTGVTYGYLDPEAVERVVAATEAGEVVPDLLRGRSSLPPVAQAADVFVRRERDERRLDAVRVVALEDAPDDPAGAVVTVDLAGERLAVTVRSVPLGAELLTGCEKPAPKDPGRYELVAIRPA